MTMSVYDYLNYEHPTGQRFEYRDGTLIAMADGTYEHSTIATNVLRAIGNRLQGSECRAFNSDLRIRIPRRARYCYSDGGVVCGKPQLELSGVKKIAILNPRLIIEVLSESTELLDRWDKFSDYRRIDSLRQYVLVSQTSPRVETYLRQDDGSWKFETFEGLNANARLDAVAIKVPLTEIFDGIEFPPVVDAD